MSQSILTSPFIVDSIDRNGTPLLPFRLPPIDRDGTRLLCERFFFAFWALIITQESKSPITSIKKIYILISMGANASITN